MIQDNIQPTSLQATSILLNRPQTSLRLRFQGGQRDGQILNIAASKCSIGSSPDATLRIVCPGMQPVHCLILRGEGGTVIRRISADTFLNGLVFDDATLKVGDRLSVGPVQFEVLGSTVSRRRNRASTHAETSAEFTRLASEFKSARSGWEQQLSEQKQRLDELSSELDERTQSLDAEREAWTTERATQQSSQNSLAEEIDSLRSQLEQAEAARSQSEQNWSGTREELDAELVMTRERFNAKEAEVTAANSELDELKSQLQSFEQGASELGQLRSRCEELASELAGANQCREEATSEQEKLSEELASAQEKLNTKQEEFTAVTSELEARQVQSAEHGDEIEQLRARCEELAQELEAANQGREEVVSQHHNVDIELAATKDELTAKTDEFAEATRELETLKRELPSADEVESLRGRCEELTRDLEAATQGNEEATLSQERFTTSQLAWEAERTEFRQHLAALVAETEELQASVQQAGAIAADNAVSETLASFEAKINDLEADRNQSRAEIESCRRELATSSEQLQVYQTEVESTRNELDAARQQLFDQQAAFKAKQLEFDAQQTALQVQQAAQSASELEQTPAPGDTIGLPASDDVSSDESTMAVDMLDRLREEVGFGQDTQVPNLLNDTSSEQFAAEPPDDLAPTVSEPQEVAISASEPVTEPVESYAPIAGDQLAFSEPEELAPVDTASILAQFGHTFEDDELETSAFDSRPNDTEFIEPAAPAAEYNSPSVEDDSIEDYMTQLMQHIGGGTYESPQSDEKTQISRTPTEQLTQQVEPPKLENIVPLHPSEFIPRAAAPEAPSNLRALRAVANTSTRSAIDKHDRRSFDRTSFLCVFVAIVSGIVCIAMAILAKSVFSLPTLISLGALIVSSFAALKAIAFTAKSQLGKKSTQKRIAASAETPAQPQPQPQAQSQEE